jgi:sterol desaturase/sphingolipid hydroxylase (fatty acid hydroxylase superfamily)
MDLVAYAVPFFILAMLLELLWGIRVGRNTYRVNDAVSSLFLGTLSQVRKFVTLGVGGYVYHWVATHFSMPQLSAGSVWTWVFATFLYDFCYYWLHRLGHERSVLWAAHVAHHQSEDYNLSTALRQTSSGFLLGWMFYLPMFFAGVPAPVVVTVGSINLIYQFWVHTQHIGKLGWYEWVFVTPSNHRVHHAQNDCYLDRNYGGVFIIWDRLFGTFQEELAHEPPVYGIRGALRSWSPLKALTHIYVDMFRDSWHAQRWRDKLYVWVARTGWRPADLVLTHPRPKSDLSSFQRYDPPVSSRVRAYALFQLLAVVMLLGFLQQGLVSGYLTGLGLVIGMFLTTIATASWLEARASAQCLRGDVCRLLFIAVGLAALAAGEADPGAVFFVASGAYLLVNIGFLFALRPARTSEDALGGDLPAT